VVSSHGYRGERNLVKQGDVTLVDARAFGAYSYLDLAERDPSLLCNPNRNQMVLEYCVVG